MKYSTNCQRVTRRHCLQLGLGAALGSGFVDMLRLTGQAAETSGQRRKTSCILIWMDGGPSHYETFDPKPEAPKEIGGQYSVIDTTGSTFCATPMPKRKASANGKAT